MNKWLSPHSSKCKPTNKLLCSYPQAHCHSTHEMLPSSPGLHGRCSYPVLSAWPMCFIYHLSTFSTLKFSTETNCSWVSKTQGGLFTSSNVQHEGEGLSQSSTPRRGISGCFLLCGNRIHPVYNVWQACWYETLEDLQLKTFNCSCCQVSLAGDPEHFLHEGHETVTLWGRHLHNHWS